MPEVYTCRLQSGHPDPGPRTGATERKVPPAPGPVTSDTARQDAPPTTPAWVFVPLFPATRTSGVTTSSRRALRVQVVLVHDGCSDLIRSKSFAQNWRYSSFLDS